jgi:hypothetical protein
MKKLTGLMAMGLLVLAGVNNVSGQLSDGVDDRFRTEDTFRDFDSRPGGLIDQVSGETNRPGRGPFSIVPGNLPKNGFGAAAQLSVGYESNPTHARVERGALYYGFNEKLGFTVTKTNDYSYGVSHTLKTIFYSDNHLANGTATTTADTIQNKITLDAEKMIGSSLILDLAGNGTYTMANEDPQNESIGISPMVIYLWPVADQWMASSLAYGYSRVGDLTHQTNPLLKDGADDHTATLYHSFFGKGELAALSNYLASATIGYGHKWHDSVGAYRSYQSDNVSIEFAGPLFRSDAFSYDITYTHTWNDYSGVGSAGPGLTRHDNADDVLSVIDYQVPLAKAPELFKKSMKLDLLLSYDFQTKVSNKSTAVYADHTVFGAVKISF